MARGYSRGWPIHFDHARWQWLYTDLGVAVDAYPDRPCSRCGRRPTVEGYDGCLGRLPGVTGACCGHGIEEPYVAHGTLIEMEGLEVSRC